MSDIKRYDVDADIFEMDDGEYVKYADHKAAIEQLQARIAELESAINYIRATSLDMTKFGPPPVVRPNILPTIIDDE